LLDAARLWKCGIPAAAILWESFERTGEAHAAVLGVTGMPLQTVADLKIGETDAEQEEKGVVAACALAKLWGGLDAAWEGATP
jgi:hypothetical protein